ALNDGDALRKFVKPFAAWIGLSMQNAPSPVPIPCFPISARYTHRVAIANSRLVSLDGERVHFKWKDYRRDGRARYAVMTVDAHEFMRRFLLHVLPDGFPSHPTLRALRQSLSRRHHRQSTLLARRRGAADAGSR